MGPRRTHAWARDARTHGLLSTVHMVDYRCTCCIRDKYTDLADWIDGHLFPIEPCPGAPAACRGRDLQTPQAWGAELDPGGVAHNSLRALTHIKTTVSLYIHLSW